MKVELKKEMTSLSGQGVTNADQSTLTLGDILFMSLDTVLEGDEKDDGPTRMRKYKLMQTIYNNKENECNLDSEDIALIKQRVLKVFPSPLAYGRVCEAFGESN
jgi:hypothetical protein